MIDPRSQEDRGHIRVKIGATYSQAKCDRPLKYKVNLVLLSYTFPFIVHTPPILGTEDVIDISFSLFALSISPKKKE